MNGKRAKASTDDTTVTVAEFCRRSKQPRTTVGRWIEAGDIKLAPDGRVPLRAGLAAVRQLRADQDGRADASGDAGGLRTQLLAAQIDYKRTAAALSRLQLQHEQGLFVLVAEVEADARAAAETIRAHLLALPSRVALQIEAALAAGPALRAPRIEALIADEINKALAVLNGTRFGATP